MELLRKAVAAAAAKCRERPSLRFFISRFISSSPDSNRRFVLMPAFGSITHGMLRMMSRKNCRVITRGNNYPLLNEYSFTRFSTIFQSTKPNAYK